MVLVARPWKPPPWPDEVRTVMLTEREGEVLLGICRGWDNFRIADHLGISTDQVKYSMKGLFRSMRSNDRAHCAVLAATGQVEILIKDPR